MSMMNPFKITQEIIEAASDLLRLPPAFSRLLQWPQAELSVSIPVQMDDGHVEFFQGHRVQYNNALGPTMGAIRIHPAESIAAARMIAAQLTWSYAFLELPFGGAQGGISCDPGGMSFSEMERLCRAFIRRTHYFIGTNRDCISPGFYTTSRMISWMLDELNQINAGANTEAFTGKPPLLGGISARDDALALSGIYSIEATAESLSINLDQATVAIVGYQKEGIAIHKLAEERWNAKVVALSDFRGGIFNSSGLSFSSVTQHKQQNGFFQTYSAADQIAHEELPVLDVDVLFLTVGGYSIGERTVGKIKAKIIAEYSSGTINPQIYDQLVGYGIYPLPAVLCNAGEHVSNYLEIEQRSNRKQWTARAIDEYIKQSVFSAFHTLEECQAKYSVDPWMASTMIGISRVSKAAELLGWA